MQEEPIIIIYTWNAIRISCGLSLVNMMFYFYKFFRSPTKQSVATRNLILYSFILSLNYLAVSFDDLTKATLEAIRQRVSSSRSSINSYAILIQYLLAALTFYKLIMAVDLCRSFRNIALHLHPHRGSQDRTFVIYCISGVGIPSLYMTIRFMYFYDEKDKKLHCKATHYELDAIRISRLVPICGALWYIWSASMNKTELWTRFSLHIRLLFLLGGFSAFLGVARLSSYALIPDDETNTDPISKKVYYFAQLFGMIFEGFVITVCFKFKNDTLQSIKRPKTEGTVFRDKV